MIKFRRSHPTLRRKFLSPSPLSRESFHSWILSSELCLNTDQISCDRELSSSQRCPIPRGKREEAGKGNCFLIGSPIDTAASRTWPDGNESSSVEFLPIVAPMVEWSFLTDQLLRVSFSLQQFPRVHQVWNNKNNSTLFHPSIKSRINVFGFVHEEQFCTRKVPIWSLIQWREKSSIWKDVFKVIHKSETQ